MLKNHGGVQLAEKTRIRRRKTLLLNLAFLLGLTTLNESMAHILYYMVYPT